MAYKLRADSLAYSKSHYDRNKQYYKDKSKKNKNRQRDHLRRIIRDAKGAPCKDCGNVYPYYVMQFDHVTGEKLFNIADGIGQGITVKKLLDEMKKCDVVCSNCHAIRTHGRRAKNKPEQPQAILQMTLDSLQVIK